MAKHTREQLKQLQSMPLSAKVEATKRRINEWYEYWEGEVYVSFSGGKDSTVLLHIVRSMYPEVEAVFVDTGLEYPEIRQFVKTFDNVTILRPKMRFDEVIKTYGYPVISKEICDTLDDWYRNIGVKETQRIRQLKGVAMYNSELSAHNKKKYLPITEMDFHVSAKCCKTMKKQPAHNFQRKTKKKAMIATLAEESRLRTTSWQQTGCNAFHLAYPQSTPMAFWTEQDVLQYIKDNDIKIASVYGNVEYETEPEQIRWSEINSEFAQFEEPQNLKLHTTGANRTGCIFCAYGAHLEKEPRFLRLKETHPRQYEYCINGGCYDENGKWIPNKEGLGMGHVFDELNNVYGEDFIKYK